MYHFQVTLHPLPPQAVRLPPRALGARTVAPLDVPHQALSTVFPVSFEEAADRLTALPRMFLEPDGSWVWVSPSADEPWQVDGVLYDRDERLLFVDLKGSCPPAALDQILSAVGWPGVPVMFQLTREAVFVDEAAFRALAERA